jgi:hypothetical protein
MRSMPFTVLFDATVTDGSLLHLLDCLLQLCVAVSQFVGLHSILLMDWLRILVGDVVHHWVLAATVTIPLASMLNGPVVNGVTLVLVVAADAA